MRHAMHQCTRRAFIRQSCQVALLAMVLGSFGFLDSALAASCQNLSGVQKNRLSLETAAQAIVQENILQGCDPAFPPRRGGLVGDATSEESTQTRVKTPPDAPSLKYQGVSPKPGCDANSFGKPGGKSDGGTTTNCEKGRGSAAPPLTKPDLTDATPPTEEERDCFRRIAKTFVQFGEDDPFNQMCAHAGVKICIYTFQHSGCMGDEDGDGGPAPPEGYFTYSGREARVGLDPLFLRGPYYLHFGGLLILPDEDNTEITIQPGQFVWLDEDTRMVYIYDAVPITYYVYTYPPNITDSVRIRANDEVLYVAICALDDSCFPEEEEGGGESATGAPAAGDAGAAGGASAGGNAGNAGP